MPQIQLFLSEDSPISLDLGEEKVTVGRLADNGLQVEDPSVSSHHAELVFENGAYVLRDLGSTNGTFVNDEQVTEVTLKAGDQVRFGQIPGIFSAEEEAGESQPLPQMSGAAASVASNSARPVNFASSSPIKRTGKAKDGLGVAMYVLASLAIIAAAVAAYFVFALDLPA